MQELGPDLAAVARFSEIEEDEERGPGRRLLEAGNARAQEVTARLQARGHEGDGEPRDPRGFAPRRDPRRQVRHPGAVRAQHLDAQGIGRGELPDRQLEAGLLIDPEDRLRRRQSAVRQRGGGGLGGLRQRRQPGARGGVGEGGGEEERPPPAPGVRHREREDAQPHLAGQGVAHQHPQRVLAGGERQLAGILHAALPDRRAGAGEVDLDRFEQRSFDAAVGGQRIEADLDPHQVARVALEQGGAVDLQDDGDADLPAGAGDAGEELRQDGDVDAPPLLAADQEGRALHLEAAGAQDAHRRRCDRRCDRNRGIRRRRGPRGEPEQRGGQGEDGRHLRGAAPPPPRSGRA